MGRCVTLLLLKVESLDSREYEWVNIVQGLSVLIFSSVVQGIGELTEFLGET